MRRDFLSPASLDTDPGPWLLAHAEMEAQDPATGRNTFGLINTVLVDQTDLGDLLDELNAPDYRGRSMIDVSSDYYVFAGEVPWHDRFASPEPATPSATDTTRSSTETDARY